MKIVVYLFLVITLTGCPANQAKYLPQALPIEVSGKFVHQPSGMEFPKVIGELERNLINQYDEQGLNVSVGYNLNKSTKPLAATVYVYPSPPITSIGSPPSVIRTAQIFLCKREYECRKQEILYHHPNARLIDEDVSPSQMNKSGFPNYSATFELEDIFAGVHQPLKSRLELTCYLDKKWTVKYRFTYPKDVDVEQELAGLKEGLPWKGNTTKDKD